MKELPKHVKDALVERMNTATPAHKAGVTGEIDVDGLLREALDNLAKDEPGLWSELTGLAPVMVARDLYQKTMRELRYHAYGSARQKRFFGEDYVPARHSNAAHERLAEAAPNLLESWTERMTPEVQAMQFSYRDSRGSWHRREYGDLTTPDMRTLQEKYEAEARSKQQTADMFRTDCDIFERLQKQFFGEPMPTMTIRDFMRTTKRSGVMGRHEIGMEANK